MEGQKDELLEHSWSTVLPMKEGKVVSTVGAPGDRVNKHQVYHGIDGQLLGGLSVAAG